ncbi:MAG: hypothetical protein OJF62_001232 [Pseudolabrys sp.]|nr:hypothetical protein [Pseudolabrys sp.]
MTPLDGPDHVTIVILGILSRERIMRKCRMGYRASPWPPPSLPGNRVRAEARPGRKLDPAIHEAVRPPRAYVRHCNLAMLHGSPGHGASRRPGDDAECGSSPGTTLNVWLLMVRSPPKAGVSNHEARRTQCTGRLSFETPRSRAAPQDEADERLAMATWCTAEPGSRLIRKESGVPGLQRTAHALRCARDARD